MGSVESIEVTDDSETKNNARPSLNSLNATPKRTFSGVPLCCGAAFLLGVFSSLRELPPTASPLLYSTLQNSHRSQTILPKCRRAVHESVHLNSQHKASAVCIHPHNTVGRSLSAPHIAIFHTVFVHWQVHSLIRTILFSH